MNIHKKLCQVAMAIAICVMCAVLCLTGCTATPRQQTYFALGSMLTVVTYVDNKALANYIQQLTLDIETAVDVTNPDSDIARFNAAPDEERVAVNAITYDMVLEARRCYDLTGGLYDPTAYWLVDLWGFLPRAKGVTMPYDRTPNIDGSFPLPDQAYVEAFRALTDMRRIEAIANEQTGEYFLVKHGSATVVQGATYYARLDMGGIAKGYAVSCMKGYIESHHITKGYLNFGASSLLLLDNSEGKAWDLTLTHPRKANATYCDLSVQNVVASTSGDYQNYYLLEGTRYCHIIDPRTGCPTRTDLLTVTVLGQSAVLLDALSTALMVGTINDLRSFARSETAKELGLSFVAVYRDGEEEKVYNTLSARLHY